MLEFDDGTARCFHVGNVNFAVYGNVTDFLPF
ncbi:hypothetical protein GGD56_002223 [Rhizobium mongolense]|uniref:Uncharacterized protein n=1 Tax=Rhizobium mongolense TaxID=57676 RepID=A0ABR6IKJ0_9HYPH|nr:hypothetical protein [Rhizobium mongolense]